MDRGACPALVGGVTSVGHDLASKPPPPPHITIIYYICFMFNLIGYHMNESFHPQELFIIISFLKIILYKVKAKITSLHINKF